eukprot:7953660-Pyramimonas_sp.AAC.1
MARATLPMPPWTKSVTMGFGLKNAKTSASPPFQSLAMDAEDAFPPSGQVVYGEGGGGPG